MSIHGNYNKSIVPEIIDKHFNIQLLRKEYECEKMIFKFKMFQLRAKYSKNPLETISLTIAGAFCYVQYAVIVAQTFSMIQEDISENKKIHSIVGEKRKELIVNKNGDIM